MNIFFPSWPCNNSNKTSNLCLLERHEKWVGLSSGHLWVMGTDLWHRRKSEGTTRLDLRTAKTDWRRAWNCKHGPVTCFTSTSDQILEEDLHFLLQLLGQSQDLKQQHHLPRVLGDFGISFSQKMLEPSLVYISGPLFQGSNRTSDVNAKLQGWKGRRTWSFITFTCWSFGGHRIKSWTCFFHSTKPENTVSLESASFTITDLPTTKTTQVDFLTSWFFLLNLWT